MFLTVVKRQFERQHRNISVGFAIDLSVTCQCGSHWQ